MHTGNRLVDLWRLNLVLLTREAAPLAPCVLEFLPLQFVALVLVTLAERNTDLPTYSPGAPGNLLFHIPPNGQVGKRFLVAVQGNLVQARATTFEHFVELHKGRVSACQSAQVKSVLNLPLRIISSSRAASSSRST